MEDGGHYQMPSSSVCLCTPSTPSTSVWAEQTAFDKSDIVRLMAFNSWNLNTKHTVKELVEASDRHLLSYKQVKVLLLKSNDNTTRQIMKSMRLNSLSQVETILFRTACGIHYDDSIKGGRKPNLSDIDQKIFLQTVIDSSNDVNYIPISVARKLAISIKASRISVAKKLLDSCNCIQMPRTRGSMRKMVKEVC